ncbi:hypothetical protein LTR78_007843 [Recurvomyces mirabilis]|uniref:NACHT-NTPase and P-loop NTPases N-terminal domain-containing protein n=1 Tax=Recurvomyces mirabilis TaxID=574656 RepID=A0AAE0WJ42_9PEZI|nr:hypothetical protein LTR78_007843 [Recurvomyces mirabilis]KAK5160115.1 hypothetical protein LTS14_002222 [Recurvomyces mirabilis]
MSGIEAILGVVSGSAGLLSLTIQLGQGAIKLKRFCETAKAAPETIARVTHDLETIVWTLQQLKRHRHDDSQSAAVVDRCIDRCRSSASKFRDLVERVENRLKQRRSINAKLYAAIKEPEIQELMADLEKTKSSSLLAYGTQMAESRSLFGAKLDLILAQVHLGNAAVAQLASQPASRMEPLPLICAPEHDAQSEIGRPMSQQIAQAGHEDISDNRVYGSAALPKKKPPRSVFRLRLGMWTWHSRCAWDIAITTSQGRWVTSLQTVNIVPPNAPIFNLCRAGDVKGMMKLVEAGQASYTDIESP